MSIDEEAEEGNDIIFLEHFSLSAVRALRKFHFPSYHRFYASRSAEEKAIMDYVEFFRGNYRRAASFLNFDARTIKQKYSILGKAVQQQGIFSQMQYESDQREEEIYDAIRSQDDWN